MGSYTLRLYFTSVILYFILPLSTAFLHNGPRSEKNKGQVLGAFADEVNSSLFYQSYIPLVLKYRIPDWRQDSLRLNRSLRCNTDDMTYSHLCPVAYHMERILAPMSITMRFYKNIFSASGGDFYEHNFSCDKIKPHFLHFSTHLNGLQPYLNEFRNRCPLGRNATLSPRIVGTSASQHAPIAFQKLQKLREEADKARKSPVKDSPMPDAPASSEWKFIEMANYASLQNSYLLAQYVDSVRWGNAFSTCQSYKLDVGLVSPIVLNDSLSQIASSLYANGYTFSLPFLNSLPHYYKIPLADCILTMSNNIFNIGFNSQGKLDWMARPPPDPANATANLVVRVLVPVVKQGLTHKLFKLAKVPYLKKHGGVDKICEVQNFQPDDTYLVEVNQTTGVSTIVGRVSPFCLSSKLCKVPEGPHKQVIDPCVSGIILKNHEMAERSCIFDCFSLPNSQLAKDKALPIFTQLTSNKYAITGLPLDNFPFLLLQCDGKTTHSFRPNTTEGAILTTLPCNCELVYGLKRYSVQPPCNEPLMVEHVMEFENSIRDTSANDFIDYLVDAFDPNQYNITYTDSGLGGGSQNETLETKQEAQVEEASQSTTTYQYHCGHVVLWLFLITLLLLNLVTIYILYRNCLISFSRLILFRRNTNNISRFENEIPVTNMNSSEF